MRGIGWLLDIAASVKARVEAMRRERRWAKLRALGMHIGEDVWLPDSTFIDTGHCFLIRIEDHCGFGDGCAVLAHDAQMDEFLDAARIGRVVIRESCHIGAHSVVLAGVEIGPRTIVGANSVVATDLPPDTVCVGSPARVVATLDDYLAKHRAAIAKAPNFDYMKYDIRFASAEQRAEMAAAVENGPAYIVGGRSAELQGLGDTPRTTKGRS